MGLGIDLVSVAAIQLAKVSGFCNYYTIGLNILFL